MAEAEKEIGIQEPQLAGERSQSENHKAVRGTIATLLINFRLEYTPPGGGETESLRRHQHNFYSAKLKNYFL
jgi:hypothetical protein